MPTPPRDGPRLAHLTSLAVGGPVARLIEPMSARETVEVVREAAHEQRPLLPLGGGSNVVCSDDGFDGWVVRSANYAMEVEHLPDDRVRLHAGAGVEWDELVAFAVAERFAGLECLSGIPGRTGASPMQNIGAYGAEVATQIHRVDVVDRATGLPLQLPGAACGFGYRSSHFKGAWRGRYLITGVSFELHRGGPARVAYEEVRSLLGLREGGAAPLHEVRDAVLSIRARKSMVYHPSDPNRRSAGSFFVNPVVPAAAAERVIHAAHGLSVPRWPDANGAVKLSAAWLIQHAGFERGYRLGRAGISSRHTLALINPGDADATDIVALARAVRDGVRERWGIRLQAEPEFIGFADHPLESDEAPR